MTERRPPVVTEDTPIGPDVDLDQEDIRLADGTRLTPQIAEGIAEHTLRTAGRPSLTEPGKHSPQVSARVPARVHDAAKRKAKMRGISVSQLLREALERYLDLPGGGVGGLSAPRAGGRPGGRRPRGR